jgi:pyridoxine kinase
MAVLSIQSNVAFGHVGNSAALFPLQLLGHEVWPVATVSFSNHPGYGAFRGRVVTAREVAAVVRGIGERGAFRRCRAVLSGYLGRAATGPVVLGAVAAVKAARPDALYCCSAVIGDRTEGRYVPASLIRFFQGKALAAADIFVANAFELGLLAGREVETVEQALAAARALAGGARIAVVTSVRPGRRRGRQRIANLAATPAGAWLVETPRLDLKAKGAGDLFAALFLGHVLDDPDPARALARATSALHAVVAASVRTGARELALVEARDALLNPPRAFPASKVA